MRRMMFRIVLPPAALVLLAACANGYDDTAATDVVRDDAGGDGAADADGASDGETAGDTDSPAPDVPDDGADGDDAAEEGGMEDAAVDEAAAEDVVDVDPVTMCPPPGGLDCTTPGPGTGEGDECFDGVTCYMDEVQAAVRGVISDHPEWFDTSTGCEVVIVDAAVYRQAVVDRLNARGDVCGYADINSVEEVVVRTNTTYSENFDILASTGCARYGGAIYTSTCAPAWL
ncbi:MAG: hypothetical protein HY907_03370 [Deltaproteobacteria bacterium]|nr:hypothetical protein [Deltaproteobacteria bacterium]